jgi:cytochrome P450
MHASLKHAYTGPNHLHICDEEAIPVVLGASSAFRKSNRKDRLVSFPSHTCSCEYAGYTATLPPGSSGSLLTLTDQRAHSKRRRLWEPAFTVSSLEGYADMLGRRVAELAQALTKRRGTVVDLAMWLGFMS